MAEAYKTGNNEEPSTSPLDGRRVIPAVVPAAAEPDEEEESTHVYDKNGDGLVVGPATNEADAKRGIEGKAVAVVGKSIREDALKVAGSDPKNQMAVAPARIATTPAAPNQPKGPEGKERSLAQKISLASVNANRYPDAQKAKQVRDFFLQHLTELQSIISSKINASNKIDISQAMDAIMRADFFINPQKNKFNGTPDQWFEHTYGFLIRLVGELCQINGEDPQIYNPVNEKIYSLRQAAIQRYESNRKKAQARASLLPPEVPSARADSDSAIVARVSELPQFPQKDATPDDDLRARGQRSLVTLKGPVIPVKLLVDEGHRPPDATPIALAAPNLPHVVPPPKPSKPRTYVAIAGAASLAVAAIVGLTRRAPDPQPASDPAAVSAHTLATAWPQIPTALASTISAQPTPSPAVKATAIPSTEAMDAGAPPASSDPAQASDAGIPANPELEKNKEYWQEQWRKQQAGQKKEAGEKQPAGKTKEAERRLQEERSKYIYE